jgi:ATP-dependent Lon protease
MPASRWNSLLEIKNLLEDDSWLEEENSALRELLLSPDLSELLQKKSEGDAAGTETTSSSEPTSKIPAVLPILPLRGLVVYPQTAVPLTIGQARSIRLVDDVVAGDERLVGLVTSRDPELDAPDPKDLYSVGTVAVVHRLFRAPDGTIRLLVQGMVRFRLGEFVQNEPYLKAHINLIPETVEEGIEIEALARNARTQFEHIGEMIPSIPRELIASVLSLEDPLQTVYTIAWTC